MSPDADQMRREFISSLGVELEHTQELADLLLASFRAEAGGFNFLGDLSLGARAVASDQIIGASRAVESNLVEARLHERSHGVLAEGGFGLPVTLEDHERAARIGAETVAFFRAIGSTLDCFAAVLVGLLRIPRSIRRASFVSVLRLDPAAAPSPALGELWSDWTALVDAHGNDPKDWLRWTLEMRHALMHRARLLDMLVARETRLPQLALPQHVMRDIAIDRLRADHHFRRKPWLPDMEHLADGQTQIADAILSEPETITIRGVATSTNTLVEETCRWLLSEWSTIESVIDSPSSSWGLEPPQMIDFAGFISEHELPAVDAMMISPRDQERVRLAAIVRDSSS